MRALSILFLLVSVGGCSLAIDNAIDGRARDGGADADADTDASDGAVDPCADEACECTSNAACGPHARCVPETHECECVPSYVGTGLNDCVFQSPIINPDFTSTDGWEVTGDAEIDVDAWGIEDTGVVRVDCTPAKLAQTFVMPARADAEPLVLEVVARGEGWGDGSSIDLFISWNDRVLPIDRETGTEWFTKRMCIGDAGFGGTIQFEVQSSYGYCLPSYTILDRVEIVPAMPGECGSNDVTNPGFETDSAWMPSFYSPGATGTAITLPSIGQGGTRGARLGAAGPGARGRYTQSFTWPITPGAAIAYWQDGTPGARIEWILDPYYAYPATLATATITQAGARFVHVCVPPYLRGLGKPLSFQLGYDAACGASCEVTIDDLHVVADPHCEAPFITDGGFDLFGLQDYASSWVPGSNPDSSGAGVVLGNGRSGAGARFFTNSTCDSASIETQALAPAPSASGGPSLSVWARRGTGTTSGGQISGLAYASLELNGTSWTETRVCISPRRANRSRYLQIAMQATPSGSCGGDTSAHQEIYVDDVTLGTDPDCPMSEP